MGRKPHRHVSRLISTFLAVVVAVGSVASFSARAEDAPSVYKFGDMKMEASTQAKGDAVPYKGSVYQIGQDTSTPANMILYQYGGTPGDDGAYSKISQYDMLDMEGTQVPIPTTVKFDISPTSSGTLYAYLKGTTTGSTGKLGNIAAFSLTGQEIHNFDIATISGLDSTGYKLANTFFAATADGGFVLLFQAIALDSTTKRYPYILKTFDAQGQQEYTQDISQDLVNSYSPTYFYNVAAFPDGRIAVYSTAAAGAVLIYNNKLERLADQTVNYSAYSAPKGIYPASDGVGIV